MEFIKTGIVPPPGSALPTNSKGLFVPHHYCGFCNVVRDMDIDEKLLRCSRCKGVYYDSEDCQRRHWSTHKLVCGINPNSIDADLSQYRVTYDEKK